MLQEKINLVPAIFLCLGIVDLISLKDKVSALNYSSYGKYIKADINFAKMLSFLVQIPVTCT